MRKKKYKVNIMGMVSIVLWSMIFALIGTSLTPTILRVNDYFVSYYYVEWVSYLVVILISILFVKDIKLVEEIEPKSELKETKPTRRKK